MTENARKVGEVGMTTREEAILWLSSFAKNKDPMTLIPKQLIRLMYKALTEQPDIVRCKDCKLYLGHGYCNRSGIHLEVNDDWYCADGERKKDDNK